MHGLEQAVEALLARARPMGPVTRPFWDAVGWVSYEDSATPLDARPFRSAAVNGRQ